jgi:hypothetical protein
MLAGALVIKPEAGVEKASPTANSAAGGGLDPEMVSHEPKVDNVDETSKLMAMNAENEPAWIHLGDYVRVQAK